MNNHSYSFSYLTQDTLDEKTKDYLLSNWEHTCRGVVGHDNPKYKQHALDVAHYVFLCTNTETNTIVGFILAFDHTFQTDLKKKYRLKPICEPNEWYLDIICVAPDQDKGLGRLFLNYFFATACQTFQKQQIRLFATDEAFDFWTQKVGFEETDNVCQPDCKISTYRYPMDPDQGRRLTKCLNCVAFVKKRKLLQLKQGPRTRSRTKRHKK